MPQEPSTQTSLVVVTVMHSQLLRRMPLLVGRQMDPETPFRSLQSLQEVLRMPVDLTAAQDSALLNSMA
jgi:hypothetical protein